MTYVRRYLVRAVEAVCILLLMMSVQGCDSVTGMAKKAAELIAPGMDDGQATGIIITKGGIAEFITCKKHRNSAAYHENSTCIHHHSSS